VLVAVRADHPCAHAVPPSQRFHAAGHYFARRLYGDWLVGLSETPSLEACDWTAPGVRPILRPITRVGVFWLANFLRVRLSEPDQALPWLLGRLGIYVLFSVRDDEPTTTTPASTGVVLRCPDKFLRL
jgi:hypothetical protein